MDQAPLVEGQIADGLKLIERLTECGETVTAAAWVHESDGGRWYLYLVTPLVSDEEGTRPAYRRIEEVRQTMPESDWIGRFQIIAVRPSHPVARAILDVQRHYLGGRQGWYSGGSLDMLSIEGAYIYPPLVPASGK
jgi:hypothetical protein